MRSQIPAHEQRASLDDKVADDASANCEYAAVGGIE